MGRWLLRPLFTAWLLGSAVSLLDSHSLTLGRVLPAAISWTWVPLLEGLALAAVWKIRPRPLPFTQAIDLFCAGNASWWLLVIAFALFSDRAPAAVWLVLAGVAAAWSVRVDYRFFHQSLKSPSPWRDIFVERATAWVPGILFFGGGALWPGLIERLK